VSNWRVIVVAIVQNEQGKYLICKKPANRGVFAGQWGLPGGGIEPGESMLEALRREVREETGLEITEIRPLFFKDGQHAKLFPDGSSREIYMIFLVFACQAQSHEVHLGEEFESYAWVDGEDIRSYDLNEQTRDTFLKMGIGE